MLYFARNRRTVWTVPGWTAPALLAGSFVVSLLVAQFALEAYPLSGDEYGYNFLAQTLRHGHLWNPAYPEPIRDVLETNYIGGHGNQRLSQYAPAWPVVLIPFQLLGIPQFATACVGLLGGILLWLVLRQIPTAGNLRLALFALSIAAPFTVFNNASFFSHTLVATTLLAIVWLDLRDAGNPSIWNRAGIGLAFSILLTTRYEVFAVAAGLFLLDGVWRHRSRLVGWALPCALGALPVTLALLAYNWQITGSPFTITTSWVSPQIGYGLHAMGVDGRNTPSKAVVRTFMWFTRWQDFAPVLFLPLYAVALWHRVRARTLRWFDLMFPGLVGFFFFFPDYGGFQYGPRYWHAAFAVMPLTLAAGLPAIEALWPIGRFRLDPLRLAAAQCASFAGFTVAYSMFLFVQTESHLTASRLTAIAPPHSMLLASSIGRRYGPWQGYAYQEFPRDHTRNGLGALGSVVVGVDLGDERTTLLCKQMPDRAIYRIQLDRMGPGGSLQSVCNLPAEAPTTIKLERNTAR